MSNVSIETEQIQQGSAPSFFFVTDLMKQQTPSENLRTNEYCKDRVRSTGLFIHLCRTCVSIQRSLFQTSHHLFHTFALHLRSTNHHWKLRRKMFARCQIPKNRHNSQNQTNSHVFPLSSSLICMSLLEVSKSSKSSNSSL